MRWLPLLGITAFLLTVGVWRPWLQRRRHGGSGVLLFRHGDWRQHLRDALGVALIVGLFGQALVAAVRPQSIATLLAPASLWPVAGAIVLFGGIAFVVVSQLDLGRSWRIGIDEGARPGLVTSGLYRFSRNPIYLAILVTFAGYALLLPTWLSVLSLLGAFLGVRQQVLGEETYLLRTYGDEYRAYAARVGRFVPGIGKLPP